MYFLAFSQKIKRSVGCFCYITLVFCMLLTWIDLSFFPNQLHTRKHPIIKLTYTCESENAHEPFPVLDIHLTVPFGAWITSSYTQQPQLLNYYYTIYTITILYSYINDKFSLVFIICLTENNPGFIREVAIEAYPYE